MCWALGNGDKEGTDLTLKRFVVHWEKQEKDGGCRSPEERMLTHLGSEEVSWRRAGCLF